MQTKPTRPRRTITTIRLRNDVMDAMKRAAVRHGRSFANLTETVLVDFLQREKAAEAEQRKL